MAGARMYYITVVYDAQNDQFVSCNVNLLGKHSMKLTPSKISDGKT
jgi:hypothetical protein